MRERFIVLTERTLLYITIGMKPGSCTIETTTVMIVRDTALTRIVTGIPVTQIGQVAAGMRVTRVVIIKLLNALR